MDYTTCCLLGYVYFKNYYEMIAIDLSNQQALDANPKAIQQITFTVNLNQAVNITMFSLLKKQKKHFRFFARNCKSITNLFCFNIILV